MCFTFIFCIFDLFQESNTASHVINTSQTQLLDKYHVENYLNSLENQPSAPQPDQSVAMVTNQIRGGSPMEMTQIMTSAADTDGGLGISIQQQASYYNQNGNLYQGNQQYNSTPGGGYPQQAITPPQQGQGQPQQAGGYNYMANQQQTTSAWDSQSYGNPAMYSMTTRYESYEDQTSVQDGREMVVGQSPEMATETVYIDSYGNQQPMVGEGSYSALNNLIRQGHERHTTAGMYNHNLYSLKM